MNIKNKKYKFIDYVFWFLFLLFTNPGGIFKAFGEDTSKVGNIDMRDYLMVLMFGCFMLISFKLYNKSREYKRVIKYLIIFILYYFIIFGFFVPIFKETINYTPFIFLKKSRKTVYSFLLFIIVYRFYLRSYVIFYKTLVLSSIIVLGLFFITFLTGIEILPISTHNRGFVDIERVFISGEGIMPLLIPMGAIAIVFKTKSNWRWLVLLSFLMMIINYLLSITRRDILGLFIYLFISMVLFNYFNHKPLIPVKKFLQVSIYMIAFGVLISVSFPKYLEAGVNGVEEAIHIINYGESSAGKKDVRLGLGKGFMQNLIMDNIIFGTGFDNRWRGRGDKEGYETSDYPFLSAIAMTGIIGILIFLPIYLILINMLINDIKFLRSHNIDFQSFEFFIFILFIVFFIYDLLQYMNWFLPVSLSRIFKWYVYLSMYLGSRKIFYNYYYRNTLKK